MNVTEVSNEGLKRAYNVVVPATSIAAQKSKRLAEISKDVKIPGFRPGKVPAAVIQQRYGQAVMGEVLEASVQEASSKVLEERSLRPALQPKIELVNFADGADLEFRMDIEVLPEIPMPDFAAISVTRLKAVPGDAQVDEALADIARRRSSLDEVAPRAAAKGEVIYVDFEGRVDGGVFRGSTGTDMPVEVCGPGFVAGFSEQLEGLAPGESRCFTLTLPDDFSVAELAGKEASFSVTAKTLKVFSVPAIDEEFAKTAGCESVGKLREMVASILQREYDGAARMKVKRQLLDALAERASFEVPAGMVDGEFNEIWKRVEADMKAGRLDEDDKGKDEDALKADYRAIAERRIRLGLMLSEIGRTNNIQVSREELQRAMQAEMARYPGQEKMVLEYFKNNQQAVEGLRSPIFEEKVVDFMLELARVEERAVTPEELAKAE